MWLSGQVAGKLFLQTTLAILGVGSGGVVSLRAQAPDSSIRVLHEIIEGLPPAAAVRLGMGGEHWIGRLARSPFDSLTLTGETGIRTVHLAEIDTLWVRGPRKQDGLMAGAGLGALMFLVLQLTADPGEPRGVRARQGLVVFLGTAGAGMLLDAISDPWVEHFPEWR